MTKRGLYIVIEGVEGVGKSTQVELLASKLRIQGGMVRTLREPDSQSELTARAIRHLTQDPRYPMNTKTEVLLYNAARSQSLEVVRRSIEAGIDCIVDRSFLTNLAVQYYGRGDIKDYESIDRIIQFAIGDMYPDVMLILDAPIEALTERLHGRYHGERFDSLDKSFLERVRNGYLTEAANRAIPVLDALKTPEDLAEEILTHISYARGVATDKPRGVEKEATPIGAVVETPTNEPHASYLAIAKKFAAGQEVSFTELESTPKYYRPVELGAKVLYAYDTILEKILLNYSQAVSDYSKYMATQAVHNKKPFKIEKLNSEARQLCRSLLPASILVDTKAGQEFEELAESSEQLSSKICKLLPNIDPEPPKLGVKLIGHSPRNEFDVLEGVIFANSDQSSASIKGLIDEMSYEKKAELLGDCLSKLTSFQNVNYSFDVFAEFRQLFDLLRYVGGEIIMQDLTPRNGYEIPEEIEIAGLADVYQQSYDLSLELYSLLQAAGFNSQAQYAVLLGHRVRARLNLNHVQIKILLDGKNLGFKKLAKDIKQQVSGVHPLIWSR